MPNKNHLSFFEIKKSQTVFPNRGHKIKPHSPVKLFCLRLNKNNLPDERGLSIWYFVQYNVNYHFQPSISKIIDGLHFV
jgi:hypothetical protein